jgi:hypothetical protein
MPGPHPATTGVIMPPGSLRGARGIACADVVMTKAKAAKATNLTMRFLPSTKFLAMHTRVFWPIHF